MPVSAIPEFLRRADGALAAAFPKEQQFLNNLALAYDALGDPRALGLDFLLVGFCMAMGTGLVKSRHDVLPADAGEGDLLPVSALPPDGTFPTGKEAAPNAPASVRASTAMALKWAAPTPAR